MTKSPRREPRAFFWSSRGWPARLVRPLLVGLVMQGVLRPLERSRTDLAHALDRQAHAVGDFHRAFDLVAFKQQHQHQIRRIRPFALEQHVADLVRQMHLVEDDAMGTPISTSNSDSRPTRNSSSRLACGSWPCATISRKRARVSATSSSDSSRSRLPPPRRNIDMVSPRYSWLRPKTMNAWFRLVTLVTWPLAGELAHCSTWKVMPGSRLATSIMAGSSASLRSRLSSSIEVMRLWSILASGSILSLVTRKEPMK